MRRAVPVFFYGGLINPRMLDKLGVSTRRQDPAVLHGYELTIAPWVNVEPRAEGQVFGVVMAMTHDELDRIYRQLKVRYSPFPVIVAQGATPLAALCYLVDETMAPAQAEESHVRVLLEAAEERAFPDWYLKRIRSYLPPFIDQASGVASHVPSAHERGHVPPDQHS